jgi:hypothetical protein
MPIILPIVSVNIAPLPPHMFHVRRFHSSISAAIATIESPPDVVPVFGCRAATSAFSAQGARSVGTISAHCRGVNWKMAKLTRDQAVGHSLIPRPERI